MKRTAFLLGSCILMLAAFRSSITWHLWKFWIASGPFWQSHWENLHRLLGGNDWTIFVTGTVFVPHLVFWGFNAILMVADVTGKPRFITRYRIQLGKNDPVDREQLYRAISTVLFNQVFISLPLSILMLPFMKWRCEPCSLELPTFHRLLLEQAVFALVVEVIIYYLHRLEHHPSLYKYIHKKHHEWTAPIGITAFYMHPVEHMAGYFISQRLKQVHSSFAVFLGANLLAVHIPSLILGCHVTSEMVWMIIFILINSVSHCGYNIPFLPAAEFHDFHHTNINQCYGVFGILDRLHGTDMLFKQRKAHERHLLNFKPLSGSIPDSPKKL